MQYLPDPRENLVAERFDAWLSDMFAAAPSVLSSELLAAVESYDSPGNRKRSLSPEQWIRYFRGVMRGEEWIVRYLGANRVDLFVELGCGVGTWCFLAALAGARRVLGIDLCEDRLAAARVLARERFASCSDARIDFVYDNLFRIAYDRPVDIFYLKSTIHHILPIPALFDYLERNLSPGGIVVIHDTNGLHPISQITALRMRGLNRRVKGTDAQTGEPTEYAMEDYFTLPGIRYRLRRHGFRIIYQQAYLGGRSSSSDRMWQGVIEPLNRSTLLGAFLAPSYQIVAQKPA